MVAGARSTIEGSVGAHPRTTFPLAVAPLAGFVPPRWRAGSVHRGGFTEGGGAPRRMRLAEDRYSKSRRGSTSERPETRHTSGTWAPMAFAKSTARIVGSLFRVPSSLFWVSVPGSRSRTIGISCSRASARTKTETWNDERNKEQRTRNRGPITRLRRDAGRRHRRVEIRSPRGLAPFARRLLQ
jgi:hypothetical protein